MYYEDFKKSANTPTNTIANTPSIFANTLPTHLNTLTINDLQRFQKGN